MSEPDFNLHKYIQHESLGRLYINRFAIDEEDQFEILGVYRLPLEGIELLTKLDEASINRIMQVIQIHRTFSYQLHILWASCFGFHEHLDSVFQLCLKLNGVESAMISILEMSKYDCITKVGFDKIVGLVTGTLHYFCNEGDFLLKICHPCS